MGEVGFGRRLLFCAVVPAVGPHGQAEEIRLMFSFPEKEAARGLRRGGFEAAAEALVDWGLEKGESETAASFKARLEFEKKAAGLFMEKLYAASAALAAYSEVCCFGTDLPDGDGLQDRAQGIFEAGFWIESRGISPSGWAKLAEGEGVGSRQIALWAREAAQEAVGAAAADAGWLDNAELFTSSWESVLRKSAGMCQAAEERLALEQAGEHGRGARRARRGI